jgi:hypothetical protein
MAHLLSFNCYHYIDSIYGLLSRGNMLSKTLSFQCSLRLLQVCSNLAAKTMRNGRKRVRIRVRNAQHRRVAESWMRCYDGANAILFAASRFLAGAASQVRRERNPLWRLFQR